MKRQTNSIDGFVPRTPRRRIGYAEKTSITPSGESNRQVVGVPHQPLHSGASDTVYEPQRISRRDVDESLRSIDDEPQVQPKPRRRGIFGRKKAKQPVSKKKIAKRIIIAIVLLMAVFGAYLGIKAFVASGNIFKGNPLGIFQNKPLKEDANGQTNILVFGTSGSIDDQRHDGANLTDTLMVLSVNQKKKTAAMVSLPRDLYVEYGAACPEGYQGKINSLYACFSNDGTDEDAGATALGKKVAEVTGLEVQYYAHVNWAVVVKAIDAVGGVDVNVQGDGQVPYGVEPGSIYDANLNVRYSPGVHRMSGQEALLFSRARGAAGGYGLARGDYDRQANQQKVLIALKEKAVSAGTLTNIGKVTGLIDALGENLRTNFDTSEIRTLMSLGSDIPQDKITQIDLADEDADVIYGDMINGASVQLSKSGQLDYTAIQAYIKKKLNANAVTREGAHIALFNASGVAGYASRRETALESRGFNITYIGNAPSGTYQDTEIYDLTGTKPATKAKLESFYNVSAVQTESPITVSSDTDFVVIYGKALKSD